MAQSARDWFECGSLAAWRSLQEVGFSVGALLDGTVCRDATGCNSTTDKVVLLLPEALQLSHQGVHRDLLQQGRGEVPQSLAAWPEGPAQRFAWPTGCFSAFIA